MAADSDRGMDLSLICETLRSVGVSEDKIEAFAKLWQEKASAQTTGDPEAMTAPPSDAAGSESPVKYSNVRVRLRDLDNRLGPILRRVSYAMRDAGVDEAEIENYKEAVKAARNPVAVSRRWVRVD
jgi:hypothetical protein